MPRKKTGAEFIAKAKEIFGDAYTYEKVVYVNNNSKVIVTCREHGDFETLPRSIISGHGCAQCVGLFMTQEMFIKKANEIHNFKYDYSEVKYINTKTKVRIKCDRHGIFEQKPNLHISSHGCPLCGCESQSISSREPVFGIGINDYDGYVYDENGMIPSYDCWTQMLRRCYSEKKLIEAPSYIGCFVCDEWLHFSSFARWFDENHIDGYCLDKDWIEHGNKEYSPNKCLFVPALVNTILTKCNTMRGHTPIGVSERNGRYIVRLATNNKQIYGGTFDTPEEAFNEYKRLKENFIKELAAEYYKDGKINIKVYNAMMKYEVLIDD